MRWSERAQAAIETRRVSIFLKVLSVLFLLGAASHLGSILGVGGTPWTARPLMFRIADAVMLPLNLILALGLWKTRLWAVFAWVVCIFFLQIVPILLYADRITGGPVDVRTLYGLLVTHASLVTIFLLLLISLRFKLPSDRT